MECHIPLRVLVFFLVYERVPEVHSQVNIVKSSFLLPGGLVLYEQQKESFETIITHFNIFVSVIIT